MEKSTCPKTGIKRLNEKDKRTRQQHQLTSGKQHAMESNGKIAEIILEPKTHNIKHIKFYGRNLRFKCKRCAIFCCKLGGPKLAFKDVERLKKGGCRETEFLDAPHGSLKNTASGSCVFLRLDTEKDIYRCEVYSNRPTLCRLYPFHTERTGLNSFVLEVMPCKGISRRSGEPINEKFIHAHLLDALNDMFFQ